MKKSILIQIFSTKPSTDMSMHNCLFIYLFSLSILLKRSESEKKKYLSLKFGHFISEITKYLCKMCIYLFI